MLLRIEQISGGALAIQHGALYAALYRLEHQGLIGSELEPSGHGHGRGAHRHKAGDLMRAWIARFRSLVRGLRRRGEVESEMMEEFRVHIELRAEDLVRRGMPAKEAARRARLEFGHVESHREAARASRGLRFLDEIGFSWLDVKLGFRMIRKYPGLSLISVIGMAVAIAIGAGAFGFISAMMDPTLPLPGGERVVALQNNTDNPGNPERRTLHDFLLWREELTAVRDVGAFRHIRRNVTTPAGTEFVSVVEMSASGFRVMRVAPVVGRPLMDEDERIGAPAVAVIGYEEWQRTFAGDEGIVGRTLRLGGTMHTVVGVMPADFRFPLNDRYWVPLRLNASDYEVGGGPALQVFGRLADGATMERAQAELTTLGARMAAEYPDTHAQLRPRVMRYTQPFFDIDSPEMALVLHLVQAAISLLLVVVAVNVAMLVYARTATRIGEITVRSALGASRRRIVAQLFAEALVVSTVAAAIGLGIAAFALSQIQAYLAREVGNELPFWFELSLSPGLVAYVAGLAILAGAIVGVAPALKATGRRVQAGLQQLSARGSQMQLGRIWTAMIVGQVAIAVAVLPFAVYIAGRSIAHGIAEPAFATEEVLHAWISIERDEAPPAALAATYDSTMRASFVDGTRALLRRLETEPAVAGVALARRPPDSGVYDRFELENGRTYTMIVNAMDVNTFEVIGVPVVAGRSFEPGDARGEPRTAIVTRAFADEFDIEGQVLGRRVRLVRGEGTGGEIVKGPWLEIVGVVPDFAVQDDFEPEPPRIYTPLALADDENLALVLRIRGVPARSFALRLSRLAASVDPRLQIDEVRTAADRHRSVRQNLLAVAAAVVAITGSVLLFSGAGIYAMMSFTVARRRREIGIRSALGAVPRRLLAGIFARAATQLGAGVLLGLLLATGIGRALLGGGPSLPDALAFFPIVAAIMVGIGLLAAVGPARRALAVQPTEALREE